MLILRALAIMRAGQSFIQQLSVVEALRLMAGLGVLEMIHGTTSQEMYVAGTVVGRRSHCPPIQS